MEKTFIYIYNIYNKYQCWPAAMSKCETLAYCVFEFDRGRKCLFSPRLIASGQPTTNLLPCPHLHNDGKLIVCDIQTPVANNIEVLFKGTVDGKPVRNTFDKSLFGT